jgi:hypothetical protein
LLIKYDRSSDVVSWRRFDSWAVFFEVCGAGDKGDDDGYAVVCLWQGILVGGFDEWFRLKTGVYFEVVNIMKASWDIERFESIFVFAFK